MLPLQNGVNQQHIPSFASLRPYPTTSTAPLLTYNNIGNSTFNGYSMDNAYNNNINNYNGFNNVNFSAINDKSDIAITPTNAVSCENWEETTSNFSAGTLQVTTEYNNAQSKLNKPSTCYPLTANVGLTPTKPDSRNFVNNFFPYNNSNYSCNNFLSQLNLFCNDNNNNYASSNSLNAMTNSNSLYIIPSQTPINPPYKTGPGSNSIFF